MMIIFDRVLFSLLAIVSFVIAINYEVMLMLGGTLGIAVSGLSAVAFVLSVIILTISFARKDKKIIS